MVIMSLISIKFYLPNYKPQKQEKMKTSIIETVGTAAIVATFLTILLLFTVFNNGNYIAHFN